MMVYLRIVFDIATTLCTLCCRSVESDRSHSPLSASLPTATPSFRLPPALFFEFRELAIKDPTWLPPVNCHPMTAELQNTVRH